MADTSGGYYLVDLPVDEFGNVQNYTTPTRVPYTMDPNTWVPLLSQPTVESNNAGGAPPNVNSGGGDWLSALLQYGPGILGLASGIGGIGAGIAGIAGGLPGGTTTVQPGGPTTSTTTSQSIIPPMSPQEQQILSQIMGGLSSFQPGQGIGDPLKLLYPAGGQYNDAATYWKMLGGAYDPMQAQLGPISMQQQNILGSLSPTAMGMAQGQLPITPGLEQTIEQAFTPAAGDVFQKAIESARSRGFAGGQELLNQGPAAAIAGPMLADLQGQMAQAKLNYALQIPQAAGTLASQYNEPLYRRTQAGLGLLNEGTGIGGGLTQAGVGAGGLLSGQSADQLNLLGRATNLLQILQQGRVSGAPTTQSTTSQPGGSTTTNSGNPIDWINAANNSIRGLFQTGQSYTLGQQPQNYGLGVWL